MFKPYSVLIKKYFEDQPFVKSDIDNYNHFIDYELQQIIEENKEIEPAIIPEKVEEFKIRFDKIRVTRPEIIEADGSKRLIFPVEARMRKITYSAPLFITVSAHIDGAQRESFETFFISTLGPHAGVGAGPRPAPCAAGAA